MREIEKTKRAVALLRAKLNAANETRREIEWLFDKLEKHAGDGETENKIASLAAKAVAEELFVFDFLDSLPDGFTRRIFELKYLDGLSYTQVAQRIGGDNSNESVKKIIKRNLFKFCRKQ